MFILVSLLRVEAIRGAEGFGGRDSFVGVGGLATTAGFFFTTITGF